MRCVQATILTLSASSRRCADSSVADVLNAGLDPIDERRVLMTGLRALEGRRDLEVL